MAVVKLAPQQLASLRARSKLNPFWESYFHDITVELNRLFFEIFREQISVKAVNLELIDVEGYLKNSRHSVTQFFKIYPHNTFGFYQLPFETIDLLLTQLLGGKMVSDIKRDLTNVDQGIIDIVSLKLGNVLEKPLVRDNRELRFQFIDLNEDILMHSLKSSKQYICVQQYVIHLKSDYYYFDLAFTNNFLNQFSLI